MDLGSMMANAGKLEVKKKKKKKMKKQMSSSWSVGKNKK